MKGHKVNFQYLEILFTILSLLFSIGSFSSDITAWSVSPHGEREILQQNSGLYLTQHSYYVVYNIGRVPIWAEIKYGTAIMWHGSVGETLVQPGEKRIIYNGDSGFFITALKLTNPTDDRVILVVGLLTQDPNVIVTDEGHRLDMDVNDFAKFFVATIADNIPVIGATLSHVIEFFWPDTEEDIWASIQDQVSGLMDAKISNAIENILDSNLRSLKRKVKALHGALKRGIRGENITEHYMNLAQDLIGVEEGFKFKRYNDIDAHRLNYVLLPLYSTVITMKLLFYRTGIVNREELGLNDAKISQISFYAEEMIEGKVFEHFAEVYEQRMNHVYLNCYPENLFNAIAAAQTFIAITGLENIPMWTQWINKPFSNNTPYDDTVILSTSTGRNTIDLLMEAKGGVIGKKLMPELIEKRINGRIIQMRDKMKQVIIDYDANYIKAITTYFHVYENTFHMGTGGPERVIINFEKVNLKKIEVFGEKVINGLILNLSNGTMYNIGNTKMKKMKTFELKNHHIIGMFAGEDKEENKDVLVNFAVSYATDHEYDFIK